MSNDYDVETDELDEDETLGFNLGEKHTNKELEEEADRLLKEDSDRELCPHCMTQEPDYLPYGKETGNVEWKIQIDKEGTPQFDEVGNTLYVAFPELTCDKKHFWYKGEGPRRDIRGKDIRGKDPILFETHLYNRKRREIHVQDGIPDPAFTMDRWGKRPTQGIYNRAHPQGRKINTPEQRAKNGASWYR